MRPDQNPLPENNIMKTSTPVLCLAADMELGTTNAYLGVIAYLKKISPAP